MIGKTISQYRILEKVGSGGMGDVYKAEDTKLRRNIALKFLPLELTRDEEAQQRFVHEARAASALDHPNIGTIHEINESEGHFFIAMAYYEGETLKEKIESRKTGLAVEEAIDIAIQIAQGLAKAHSKGIIHRDIKPANVLITDDGQVKIIDFGLAKLKGRTVLTKTGTTMGTIAYMSPEQTQGAAVDHRTDIWALGVLLYEMLAGEHPFKGDYEQAVMYSILNEEPEFITKMRGEVPGQIEKRILEKALAKSPEKRFQTMEEMLVELNNAAEELKEGHRRKPRVFRLGRKQRRAVYRVFAVVLMAIVFGIYLWQSKVAEATPVSIALLPLASITNDADQAWFTDGMTDALITDMAKISGLRVISRSSAMRYKGTSKAPSEIAKELGVEYVIEGSVVKMGDQVKVSARLIDARKDEYLWAQDYERDFRNILTLQGEIAQTIADQIQVKLTPQEETRLAGARQVNPETYEAYLKGMFYLNKSTPADFKTGMTYLNEAVEKNPADAMAYAGLALGYATLGHGPAPPEDAWPRARAAALRAVTLDSTMAEAYAALADIKLYYEWDWKGAEKAFQRAMELNPSLAMNHYHYAWYLGLFGRLDEAVVEHKRAQELDPLTPLHTVWLGGLYWYGGRYEEALIEARKLVERYPDNAVRLFVLGTSAASLGMYEEAITAHEKLVAINPFWKYALGRTYAAAGRKDDARRILAELEAQEATSWNALGLAELHSALGQKDEAFRWLAYEPPHAWLPWSRTNPALEPLRDDPRFRDLLLRMNLPEYETFAKK
ncbi:MAG: protein kinase [bacterium]